VDTISNSPGRDFISVRLASPADLEIPELDGPFPCLVWDHDGKTSGAQRKSIAAALIDSDCRYVVCGGANCSEWENIVDLEYVSRHLDASDEALDASHVMTTSHEGEGVDDVAFFFVFNTNFDDHDFKSYLLLHVGSSDLMENLESAVRKYAE